MLITVGLVHIKYTGCTLHVTDNPNNPNLDCWYGKYYYGTHPVRLCFSDIRCFCWILFLLVSAECIEVLLSLQLFQSHSDSVLVVRVDLSCRMQLSFAVLWPINYDCVCNCDPLSVDMVITQFYNCQTCTRLSNIVLSTIQ